MTIPVPIFDFEITWKKLPDDFILENQPLQNIDQSLLAAALREILEIAGLILEGTLVAANVAICATLNNKPFIKAPDWFYARNVQPLSSQEIRRSYTPNLEGEIPVLVIEFLLPNPYDEYSNKPSYPPGKWFFYKKIVRVPTYALFESATGVLEIYQLDSEGDYQLRKADLNGRYWIEGVGLSLGVWQGTKAERTGYWLRWWDESGQMLLWGAEMVERERQERAIVQKRADRLAAQLRAAGIEPEA